MHKISLLAVPISSFGTDFFHTPMVDIRSVLYDHAKLTFLPGVELFDSQQAEALDFD